MSITIQAGIIASPGIRMGEAYVVAGDNTKFPKYTIKDEDAPYELLRLRSAVEKTRQDISEIREQTAQSISSEMSDIFSAHLMFLNDPLFLKQISEEITLKKRNAEWAADKISRAFVESLNAADDDYFRERIADIYDISRRVIANLQKRHTDFISGIEREVILFAHDITPSEAAIMNRQYIQALVTSQGGKTSHTAIMAKALQIPAFVGVKNITFMVKNGDTVIVDAIDGKLIINPDENEISEFGVKYKEFNERQAELTKLTSLSARTLDKKDIFIYGNIDIPQAAESIQSRGAYGIGLFRSEFLFLGDSLPDEEKQFKEYKKVVEAFNPRPVTIRTLDAGGDKILPNGKNRIELNPFLGCRAIRFSIKNKEFFKIQLRAILRASAFGNVKLMFPMISTPDELQQARTITEDVKDSLRKEGIPFDENIQVGIMIEVPSAAINADILARDADFFSVGTNDLIQYLLAVDRINEDVAHLYNHLDLSLLKILKLIVVTAAERDIPLSICGEMAGEPMYTMLLLGFGFRRFSMSPDCMPGIKRIIRSVTIAECENLAKEIMGLYNSEEIENIVRERFKNKLK
ncbi:MAG: phosphoenolpyruvate--protein phosphotransferase [Spirochaetia bacterium]|jgi:phosphotransferase system enzyme I (PtsI)|nr:phosphoenolpyruvate--protein phosphotransferase [Spirochaetia bacterium]